MFVCWAVMLSVGPPCCLAEGAERRIAALPEVARYQLGDDPAWAAAEHEDEDWKEIATGQSWNREGVRGVGGRGWYRWRVNLPESAEDESLAVVFGFVGSISEIYLNGTRIGGQGDIAKGEWPPLRTLHMAFIPRGLARLGRQGENVFALRVRGVGGLSGMLGGPRGIYPADQAVRMKLRLEGVREFARMAGSVLCLAWMGVMILLRSLGMRMPGAVGAAALAVMMALVTLQQTQWFQSTSLWGEGAIFVVWLILVVFPPTLYLHTQALYPRARWRLWDLAVALSAVGFVGVTGRFYDAGESWPIAAGYAAHFVVCGIASLLIALMAWRTGQRSAGASLLATGLVVICGLMDLSNLFVPWQPIAALPLSANEIGTVLFVLVHGWALLTRFAATRRRETAMRVRLLRAHEDERRRIGHDLHDGLAQQLQGLLLKVQMGKKDGAPEGLSADLKSAVREVRLVARDLQPMHLRDATLRQAIEALVGEANASGDSQVGVDFVCTEEAAAAMADQPKRPTEIVYRVIQESLNNALQHAHASRIRIEALREGEALMFIIEDDGLGFDPEAALRGNRMGLAFMRDRADLIGGRFTIRSGPDGTKCRLWLPADEGMHLDSRIITRS